MKQKSTSLRTMLSKALAFFAISSFTAIQGTAQICASPGTVIYALTNSGTIYPITASTGSFGTAVNSTSLGSTSTANAIGYNPVNGLFYYFQNASNGASQQFVSYNPTTTAYTTLAQAPISGTAYKGCVSFNGTGYYCIDGSGNLCYYDITNNTWVLVCSTFTDQYGDNVTSTLGSLYSGDIAIDGLGNLWIITSSATKYGLYKLSAPLPTTSVSSITLKQLVAPTTATPGSVSFVGIAFDPSGNIYLANNWNLYIMKANYAVTFVASFSTGGVCGDLTSCNFPFGILPVSWESFTATVQSNNGVVLAWQVSAQIDNKGYYVEHSADGMNWDDLGYVQSAATSKSSETYTYTDIDPVPGSNYYRIKQVDIDGNESYSEIKMITVASKNSQLSIWPNPAKDMVNLKYDGNGSDARAVILDQMGRMITSTVLHSGENSVNVSNLSTGSYILHVQSADGAVFNGKLIKK